MRVLIIDRFDYSCRSGHALSLARELNRQGIRTTVAMTNMPVGAYREYSNYYRGDFELLAPQNSAEIYRAARKLNLSLIHLHCSSLLPLGIGLREELGRPFGLTGQGEMGQKELPLLRQAAFVTASNGAALAAIKPLYPRAIFLQEGIDLQEFQPAPRRDGFPVTLIAAQGEYSGESYHALFKAVTIAGMDLQIICLQPLPAESGRFYGWPPGRAQILAGSPVVAGSRRALLEGMACGNGALLLGQGYGGILEPAALPQPVQTDLSATTGGDPCYRDIFYDLSRLWKDRPYLTRLQEQGRQLVRENYDLRLITERLADIYGPAATRI